MPPEHFLCNVAATGLSLFAKRTCEGIFVVKSFWQCLQVNCAKTILLQDMFWNHFGSGGNSENLVSVSVIDRVYPKLSTTPAKDLLLPEINSKTIQRCKRKCNFRVPNSR